ncbi:MAG: hypothetical protein QOG04_884 [Actinomycetota bacterium]|nr:hypothetical protein [Actinomycetota bacterium]
MDLELQDLIEAADMNGLLRAVDALCSSRDWDGLVELADRCEEALERGKQLWPIADHIDYRLALEAPGDYAASVLDGTPSRFALGPLTEVAASTHSWADLADHIEAPQAAAFVAQERVLRREVLEGDLRAHPEVLELPLRLQEWEPGYTLATYRSNVVEIAEPWDPKARLEETEISSGAEELDEEELVHALLDLVTPWTQESNGAARAVVVEGTAVDAASALTLDALRIGRLRGDEALQRIAWAAASGGAHGRRRGAATGRSMAWYLVALLGDVGWPASPESVFDALERLQWSYWDEGAPEEGWVLRLAVADPENGWAAAIAATDLLEEEVEL